MTALASVSSSPLDAVLRDFAEDARHFVGLLQHPRPSDGKWQERAQHLCADLSGRLGELGHGLRQSYGAIPEALGDLGTTLHQTAAALGERYNRRQLKALRDHLARRYEDFVEQIRPLPAFSTVESTALRAVRLPRVARSLFHVAMGLTGTLVYALWMERSTALWLLGSFFGLFLGLEISRRFSARFNDFLVFKVFGAISRPRERYQVNSATYYLAAVTLITALAPREAVGAALLALAFGDPLASFIGSRFGRLKLLNDKSLAGTLAFVGAATIAISAYWIIAIPAMPLASLILRATVVATVGAVTELFSQRIDDNFSIPVVCAMAAMLVLAW